MGKLQIMRKSIDYIDYWDYDADIFSISMYPIVEVPNTNIIGNDQCNSEILVGCANPNYLSYWTTQIGENDTVFSDVVGVIGAIYEPHYSSTDGSLDVSLIPNVQDESCNTDALVWDCMDSTYLEYNPQANIHVESQCIYKIIYGCLEPEYLEYWDWDDELFTVSLQSPLPNTDDGSCLTDTIQGCTNNLGDNYAIL